VDPQAIPRETLPYAQSLYKGRLHYQPCSPGFYRPISHLTCGLVAKQIQIHKLGLCLACRFSVVVTCWTRST